MQRVAVVAGLVGAASLGVMSVSGQAFADTQPAAATHSLTTAGVARSAASTASPFRFYGPYSTDQECLDAQAAVVARGGVVAWTCGFTTLYPTPQFGFFASE
jgi:hypothetical protein